MQCKVVAVHSPSEAESAFLHADYDKAAALYQAQLQQHPNDPDAIVGLVQVLLRQQKVNEAVDTAKKGLSADPKSVPMMIALAEAEYRAGAPWQSAALANEALQGDPCYPRLYLMLARLSRLDSMYATSAKELRTAHTLDPHDRDDPQAYGWIRYQRTERIHELEAYHGLADRRRRRRHSSHDDVPGLVEEAGGGAAQGLPPGFRGDLDRDSLCSGF